MKNRGLILTILSGCLAGSLAWPVYAAGWEKQDQGQPAWKYQEEDGSYVRNSWKEEDGTWYYFDGSGKMVTGSYLIDGKKERFDANGAWVENPDSQKQQNDSGLDKEPLPGPGTGGWKQDETGWYYQNFDGSYYQNGWKKIKGKWYYFKEDGCMAENAWIDTDGLRYRVGSDGAMLTDPVITADGLEYQLDENGALKENENFHAKTEEELQAEAIASQIVASITNDSMNKVQKANAIYDYVRGNMNYTYGGLRPESGDAAAALYGFRRHYGNCFEYYAMSKYLLEAAGMPNQMVTRASDGDHFWNLVDVDGVWYHFDTTPRRTGGRWCLVTTAELRNSWAAHNFDTSAYPATP